MKILKTRLFRNLLLIVIFLSLGDMISAQTILYPTDDTYAHMSANSSNYGSDSLLYSINN